MSREVPVKARRTEDPPLKDDKQYFIEPVLPNKIEHAVQEESQTVRENAISFETTETNEEQSRESTDRVNIKTPNVVGSSTQPVEGVESFELVAGDKSTTEAPKEDSMEKVNLKTRKPKGSENNKTASQKEEGIEKVTLKSTKQRENQKEIGSKGSSSTELKPAGANGKKENKLEETRELQVLKSDLGKTNAENLIEQEEQSTNNRKDEVKKDKKITSTEQKPRQIQKERVTKDSTSDVKRPVVKEEKTNEAKITKEEKENKTAPSSSSSSSSSFSSDDSEKKVEPKKKLSHSTSREEDKIQIKVPEIKRREIDTSQKTAPIQKDDSTELKYVVEEPTEERETSSEPKKKQLDVVEMSDDQAGVSEKMSPFTVQEPETPDSPDFRKTDLPEELEPRKEQTPTKGKLQPKIAEEKSVIQQTPSQTQSSVPKIQAETEASKTSRGYKTEHIKTKPQEREVVRVGFRECHHLQTLISGMIQLLLETKKMSMY